MSPQDPSPGREDKPSEPLEQHAPRVSEDESLLRRILAETRSAQPERVPAVEKPIGFHPREISALINTHVVARHADEAPFLWLLRDRAVTAPHYSLRDLAKLDERVEAHLDGLRVAGDHGWKLSEKALAWAQPGEVFAAGVLALESGDADRLARVLEVACSRKTNQRGLISAAGWTRFDRIRPVLDSWLTSELACVRRVAVGAFAAHRQDPGKALVPRIFDEDASVRARSYKAVAELGRVDLLPMMLHARADRDAACRFCAAWSATRLGDRAPESLQILKETAAVPGPYQERALTQAMRCVALPEAHDWLRQLWKDPLNLRLAALGSGAVGDPALVGVLIEWMDIPEVARVAGEAFSMITGADLKYLDLDRDPPERPEDQGEAAFEALDADRDLPYPDSDLVANWWRSKMEQFPPGQRRLSGSSIDAKNLRNVLLHGKQRQRASAALELALLHPSVAMFDVRARGGLQECRLETWTL